VLFQAICEDSMSIHFFQIYKSNMESANLPNAEAWQGDIINDTGNIINISLQEYVYQQSPHGDVVSSVLVAS
jgi:hypothetical protein